MSYVSIAKRCKSAELPRYEDGRIAPYDYTYCDAYRHWLLGYCPKTEGKCRAS